MIYNNINNYVPPALWKHTHVVIEVLAVMAVGLLPGAVGQVNSVIENPLPFSAVFEESEGFSALERAHGAGVFEKGGRIYAIVVAWDDDGVQIMDITNPAQPVPVLAVFEESEGFSALDGANEVSVFEKEGRTYAIVTSGFDNGVQIMDIAPPASDNLEPLIRAIYDTTTARLVLLFSDPVITVGPGKISLIRDVGDVQNGMDTLQSYQSTLIVLSGFDVYAK